jgi:hypothetical protein
MNVSDQSDTVARILRDVAAHLFGGGANVGLPAHGVGSLGNPRKTLLNYFARI